VLDRTGAACIRNANQRGTWKLAELEAIPREVGVLFREIHEGLGRGQERDVDATLKTRNRARPEDLGAALVAIPGVELEIALNARKQ
jgi:hypothetical protein